MANKEYISDELLAAYLDGNTNEKETQSVLDAMKVDPELREVLDIALQVEDDNAQIKQGILPMLQMAAKGGENICAVFCEIFILHRRGIPYNQEELLSSAKLRGWLKAKGTPLFCIGNLLAYSGLMVCRRYDSTLSDIRQALKRDNDVVVGVDREKLYAEEIDMEDLTNHAVVVTHIEDDAVTIFDPYQEPYISRIPVTDFMNAWKESHHYTIQVLQSADEYEPHPVKLENIIIDEDLEELQEAIAENAHEVWAEARIKEGWTYGRERDDIKKTHPDLIPYSALPDSEKEYDRLMALETIRLVKKLGFDIVRNKR
jgi:hypothetical protein